MVCHSILLVSECALLSAGGFAAHFEDSKQRETTFSLSFKIEMNSRVKLRSKRTLNDPSTRFYRCTIFGFHLENPSKRASECEQSSVLDSSIAISSDDETRENKKRIEGGII